MSTISTASAQHARRAVTLALALTLLLAATMAATAPVTAVTFDLPASAVLHEVGVTTLLPASDNRQTGTVKW